MAEYARLRQSYQSQNRGDPLKVSIDSFNSEFFSARNEAFTSPEACQEKGDEVWKLMQEVLPQLNKI